MNIKDDVQKKDKSPGMMSLYMSIMMSFSLTMIGLLQAGDFSLGNAVLNFVISFMIMRIISCFFDAGKVSMDLLSKHSIDPHSAKGRILMALIIDLINSPIMTFVMVTIAYIRAKNSGIQMPYLPILLRSMAISTVCSFFLCLIFTPLFEKILNRKKEE